MREQRQPASLNLTFRLTRSNNTASGVRALKPPRLAQGVIQSGIPEDLTPGYWDVATVIDLSIGLWAAIGRKDHLALHSALQVSSGNPSLRLVLESLNLLCLAIYEESLKVKGISYSRRSG